MTKARKTQKRPRSSDLKVDYSGSPTALAIQLESAHQRITDLEASNRAYRARLEVTTGTAADPHAGDPAKSLQVLLERMAAALQLAGVAELAHAAGAIHDGPPTRSLRDTERPMPGSGTNPPRARARELRSDILDALGRFEWASENGWFRKPNPDAAIPRVRCGVRACPARDLPVKAWRRIRGGRTIYTERCSSCGTPFPPANPDSSALPPQDQAIPA